MAMRLIWRGRAGWLADEVDGDALIFEGSDGSRINVDYGDSELIVDPSDDQLEAALSGKPIPEDPEADAELASMIVELRAHSDLTGSNYTGEQCPRHGVALADCPEECPLRAGFLGH